MEALILAKIVSLVAVTNALVDFLKRLIKCDKKWVNELLSWSIAIATGFVAWVIGYVPMFFTPDWACALFLGICIAISANWMYGYEWVKKILDIIFQFIDGKWYEKKSE